MKYDYIFTFDCFIVSGVSTSMAYFRLVIRHHCDEIHGVSNMNIVKVATSTIWAYRGIKCDLWTEKRIELSYVLFQSNGQFVFIVVSLNYMVNII